MRCKNSVMLQKLLAPVSLGHVTDFWESRKGKALPGIDTLRHTLVGTYSFYWMNGISFRAWPILVFCILDAFLSFFHAKFTTARRQLMGVLYFHAFLHVFSMLCLLLGTHP